MSEERGALLRITQHRSSIGRLEKQKATLVALGLGRIGSSVERTDRPEIRGMIDRVAHLVTVETLSESPR